MDGCCGGCRSGLVCVKANGPEVPFQLAQLSSGEALSAAAGQGADGGRRTRKQVDRSRDFAQRAVEPSGAAARFDHVVTGRNEGCAHVLPLEFWCGSLGMTVKVDEMLDWRSESAGNAADRDLLLLGWGVGIDQLVVKPAVARVVHDRSQRRV
jgi:hypothetical protein